VLATLPNIDATTLNAIVNYRKGGQTFQTIGDFIGIQDLSRTEVQNVLPYICTKSAYYKVRVRVRTQSGTGTYAISALVQMTDKGPQIMQWREAQRSSGWALWMTPPKLSTPTPPASSGASTNTGKTGGATP